MSTSSPFQNPQVNSYINHITHIQNIPNPDQIQYMNYTHSVAWSFNKDKSVRQKKYKKIIINIVKPDCDDPQFTPSPANYNVKDLSGKTSAWVIGKTQRKLTDIKSTTPGSGQHKYKTCIGEGPKYSMRPKYDLDGVTQGKRNSKAHKKSSVPGPGKYNPLDNTGGPKYTIGMRRTLSNAQLKKKNKKHETPGVVKYDLRHEADLIVPCYIMYKEKEII